MGALNLYLYKYSSRPRTPLSDAVMQKCFQHFQPPGGEIIVAVAGELEVDQFPEMLALTVGHEGRGKLIEGRAKTGVRVLA